VRSQWHYGIYTTTQGGSTTPPLASSATAEARLNRPMGAVADRLQTSKINGSAGQPIKRLTYRIPNAL